MIEHSISPIFLNLGFMQIRWYGLIFLIGIFLCYFLAQRIAKEKGINLSKKDWENILFVSVISILIGARLGSVASEFQLYQDNLLLILAVWNGGLAFHGALVGMILAGIYISKKYKMTFLQLADILVIPITLALAFGRIANFINGEFYGIVTELPWGVVFAGVEGARHPVQLYESLQMFVMFGLLWKFRNKLPTGAIFGIFLVSYAIIRFLLEFLKDPNQVNHVLGLTWGQFWNIPMLIAGAYLIYSAFKMKPNSEN